MQTKRIEKQLHRISEVLLLLAEETQPTCLSLAVAFWASARAGRTEARLAERMPGVIMAS